ncbi:MAG: cell division protein ZapA [Cyclobacteriaceae bacterium]|nr:cell division protein ZapA [Cyclobacteriaceae bacterium]MCX7638106.1 cell division protein ZapA [Cyclobacteriaceae bacterium]MDW8331099.1 cell division protein ZapA [Cyclobacteriaceae bacterium]
MEELSIRIKIADREYPMKVKPQDEEKVRQAGRLINERIAAYRNQFGIEDKQDLLAMVAFDSLVEKMTSEEKQQVFGQALMEKVNHLNNLVTQSIL